MAIRNTSATYGSVARALHWSIALLIVFQLAVGLSFDRLSAMGYHLMPLHKSIGVTVLALAVARVLWWLREVKPALVSTVPAPLKPLVNAGHYALYAFMFAMPLSGWILSNAAGRPVNVFGLFTLPEIAAKNIAVRDAFGQLHGFGGWLLAWLVGLHVLAALMHHFIFRDATLRRMLTGAKAR